MTHDVALLMVTFARREMFREAVGSFLRHATLRAVVVVDNNSVEMLERSTLEEIYGSPYQIGSIVLEARSYEYSVWKFGDVTLYHLPSGANIGGAGGFRLGNLFATTLKLATFIYFTDDDVFVKEDPFPPLLSVLEHSNIPFASSLIYNEHSSGFELNQHKRRFDSVTLAEDSIRVEHLEEESVSIEANGFVGVLCVAAFCNYLGGVYGSYFVLYDDVDMTYRLSRAYGPGRLVPASRIFHRALPGLGYPSWKVALHLRNRVIFARRCFSLRARVRTFTVSMYTLVHLRGQTLRFKIRVLKHLITSVMGIDCSFNPQRFRD